MAVGGWVWCEEYGCEWVGVGCGGVGVVAGAGIMASQA